MLARQMKRLIVLVSLLAFAAAVAWVLATATMDAASRVPATAGDTPTAAEANAKLDIHPPPTTRDMPPATGNAYYYRQIGLGVAIVGVMIAIIVWVVRRQIHVVDQR